MMIDDVLYFSWIDFININISLAVIGSNPVVVRHEEF
jgi:hypothetical protein